MKKCKKRPQSLISKKLHPTVFFCSLRNHGGYVGATISVIVAGGQIAIPLSALLPLAILGLVAIPFSQVMISTGTRYIPAAESALINSLETVLGILYVWMFLGEAPTIDFIIGATVVMISISANSLYQAMVRESRHGH